ncbi:DNA-binding WRKY transcription factor [Tanacetum coccineum]
MKVWVGKLKSIEHIYGNWEESYNALPKFLAALQKFNPETIVEWNTQSFLIIDGTHLYGKYTGKMMIAMGVDGNNQIFPLAFAIVVNDHRSPWLEPRGFHRVVHYFNVRRPLRVFAQANENLYTPHVAAKQAALMAKASAHAMRSFNREKWIFKVTTQRGKNVQVVNLEKQT